jgi:Reverse transcriptase (RNA-dependent DNA polymerase)
VHDAIVRAIDSGEVCALVLLDLSPAFDTVYHNTLLHVMNQRFGVDGPTLAWFGSYLADRTQVFHYGTQRSGPHTVSCSVPQGSVLGPKEFIAYTEELTELIDGYQLGRSPLVR